MVMPSSAKMRGRIHMRAVLSDHFVICAAKSVAWRWCKGCRVCGSTAGVIFAWPKPDHTGVLGPKTVGQIDKLLTRDDPIGATKLRLCLRSARQDQIRSQQPQARSDSAPARPRADSSFPPQTHASKSSR